MRWLRPVTIKRRRIPINPREALEMRFTRSRRDILLLIAFTAINVVLVLIESDITFLFSASFPIFSVAFGQGMSEGAGNSFFMIFGIVMAFLTIGAFGLCYLLSKKLKVFMLVALVLVIMDSLFLGWLFLQIEMDFSLILDGLFHAWMIWSFAAGTKAWMKLKKLPKTQEDELVAKASNDENTY